MVHVCIEYRWVPFEKARLALACSQYMCLSNCSSPNASAAENSAKRSEGAEKMEDFFGIEEDDEINNDASEADDDYCAPTSEDLLSTKHGLPFAHSGGKDESMEKNKERTPGLGKIILLLNNQCLTFEVCKLNSGRTIAIAAVLPSFYYCRHSIVCFEFFSLAFLTYALLYYTLGVTTVQDCPVQQYCDTCLFGELFVWVGSAC